MEYHDGRHPVDDRERHLLRDGSTRLSGGKVVLPGHWMDLADSPERRTSLLAQFGREAAHGHALEGKILDLLASCTICDDVLFHVLDDDAYAIAHLTWRGSREQRTERPSTDLHHDSASLLADLCVRHPWRMTEV